MTCRQQINRDYRRDVEFKQTAGRNGNYKHNSPAYARGVVETVSHLKFRIKNEGFRELLKEGLILGIKRPGISAKADFSPEYVAEVKMSMVDGINLASWVQEYAMRSGISYREVEYSYTLPKGWSFQAISEKIKAIVQPKAIFTFQVRLNGTSFIELIKSRSIPVAREKDFPGLKTNGESEEERKFAERFGKIRSEQFEAVLKNYKELSNMPRAVKRTLNWIIWVGHYRDTVAIGAYIPFEREVGYIERILEKRKSN